MSRFLRIALLGFKVYIEETIAFFVTIRPREDVHERPDEVTFDISTICNRIRQDLTDNGVGLTDGQLSDSVKEKIAVFKKAIIEGKQEVPAKP